HERTSRRLSLEPLPDKTSASVRRRLSDRFAALPRHLRRSLTFDNGTEFALHYKLSCKLAHGTFFCDPHAPWQTSSGFQSLRWSDWREKAMRAMLEWLKASRMPSEGCAASCRARPTSKHSTRTSSNALSSA